MDFDGAAKVSSAELQTLQCDLVHLSNELHKLYELMNSDVSGLGEYWRDQKYEEFLTGYKPQMEKLEEISERYREWATKDLQTTIDNVIDAEGVDVSGDEGGGSVSVGDGGGPASPVNPFLPDKKGKAEKVREATNKVRNSMGGSSEIGIPSAVQHKYNDEKTHKGGMDANEREYPHQGIIKEMEKEKAEKANAQNNMFAFLMQNNRSR